MAEDREKCFASGCNAYLSKPVQEETLLRTVDQYLGKDSTTLPNGNLAVGIAGFQSLASDADASNGSIVPKLRLFGDEASLNALPEKLI
jgi:two-component SAPR family response regulator